MLARNINRTPSDWNLLAMNLGGGRSEPGFGQPGWRDDALAWHQNRIDNPYAGVPRGTGFGYETPLDYTPSGTSGGGVGPDAGILENLGAILSGEGATQARQNLAEQLTQPGAAGLGGGGGAAGGSFVGGILAPQVDKLLTQAGAGHVLADVAGNAISDIAGPLGAGLGSYLTTGSAQNAAGSSVGALLGGLTPLGPLGAAIGGALGGALTPFQPRAPRNQVYYDPQTGDLQSVLKGGDVPLGGIALPGVTQTGQQGGALGNIYDTAESELYPGLWRVPGVSRDGHQVFRDAQGGLHTGTKDNVGQVDRGWGGIDPLNFSISLPSVPVPQASAGLPSPVAPGPAAPVSIPQMPPPQMIDRNAIQRAMAGWTPDLSNIRIRL